MSEFPPQLTVFLLVYVVTDIILKVGRFISKARRERKSKSASRPTVITKA